MDKPGYDSEGKKTYGNPSELWDAVEKNGDKDATWYGEAVAYWDRQEASYDGVLGGHGHVSDADIRESRAFLRASLGAERFDAAERSCGTSDDDSGGSEGHHLTAADCGAGVGRVSEELLLRVCSVVDLVEPSGVMLEGAKKRLLLAPPSSSDNEKKNRPFRGTPGRFLQVGLQAFEPEQGRYDVIWVQWALLYLTDDDAVSFLKRAHAALKPNGVLVVKENVCSSGFVVDDSDRSLTRSHQYMLQLFEKAGVSVSRHARQRDLPRGLFGVRMYACVKKE